MDSEHPFPFISNLGLNLAVLLSGGQGGREQFLRIKVPNNRPRWVPLPGGGYVPLEQVIAANLDLMYPADQSLKVYFFQVTRGAEGEVQPGPEEEETLREPGSLVQQVGSEPQGPALRRRRQAPGGARHAQGAGEVVDPAAQNRSGRRLFLQSPGGSQRPSPTEDKRWRKDKFPGP